MKIYFILVLLNFSFYLSAQTFIGPTIGYDFASLHTEQILQEGYIENGRWHDRLVAKRADNDTPAGRRSIVFGFQVQKILSEKWFLGIRANYTKKEYLEIIDTATPITFLPVYKQPYRQFDLSFFVSRKIREKFSLGIGPNISFFNKWGSSTYAIDFEKYRVNKRAYGLDVQLGYYLKSFFIHVNYTRTLKIIDPSNYLTGTSSLAISGTYLFKLKKRK